MDRHIIKRETYLNRIRPFVGVQTAKVILGIRRSGKSTLMNMIRSEIIAKDDSANIVTIDMELFSNRDITNAEKLYERTVSEYRDGKNNYIFIDEVQDIPGWEKVIRSLIAEGKYDVFLTVSNSVLLSPEYVSKLCGRYVSIGVNPLSFRECLTFPSASDGSSTDELFERYLRRGGFPIIWMSDMTDSEAYAILKDVRYAIILRDLVKKHKIKDVDLLDRIIMYLCDNIGNITSLNNIYETLSKEYSSVGKDTIYKYAGYLEEAFLIRRVDEYNIKGKKLLNPKYKFYLTDLGLRHAVMGYRSEDIAGYLENIVFIDLINRGYSVHVGNNRSKEIDFVAERGPDKLYVQVTYRLSSEDVIKREFGNLEGIGDNHPKIVVTMDPDWRSGNMNGVRYMHITDFLLSNEF